MYEPRKSSAAEWELARSAVGAASRIWRIARKDQAQQVTEGDVQPECEESFELLAASFEPKGLLATRGPKLKAKKGTPLSGALFYLPQLNFYLVSFNPPAPNSLRCAIGRTARAATAGAPAAAP